MRLIEWNSQGAFRKKNARILSFEPDILVVAECENQERLKFGELTPQPNDFFWHGDRKSSGLAVFSYSDYKFKLHETFNPEFRYIIPLQAVRGNESFLLLAIWAMNNKDNYEARYIGQVWLAINYYASLLTEKTILIGDFNSNKIWDYKDRIGTHTDVVEKLAEKNIHSLYHHCRCIEHGKETEPTFFMQRNRNKPYHIDYCFASKEIIRDGYTFNIGTYDHWQDLSDHTPIIITTNTESIAL
jgi:exonuclease III